MSTSDREVVHGADADGRAYVRTLSLTKVHFLDPKPSEIVVDDIAWSLAGQCRFTAGLKPWYSVAEHCVLGAQRIRDRKQAREFLIHDAAQYIFGDIASPIARALRGCELKHASDNFQYFLNHMFLGYMEVHPSVKQLDRAFCATEMWLIRGQTGAQVEEDYPGCTLMTDQNFPCWDRETAYAAWMDYFHLLFPEYKGG